MNTNELLYILIGLMIILIGAVLILLIRIKKTPKEYMMLGALKEQLDDQDENEKTLLYKLGFVGLNCLTPSLHIYDDLTYEFYNTYTTDGTNPTLNEFLNTTELTVSSFTCGLESE